MLVLVRHAESSANAEARLLGRAEVPLTERGRAQVGGLTAALGPLSKVVSSPLARAVETAEGIAGGRAVVTDDRWIEMDYGDLDGRPLAEVPASLWSSWRADPSFRPPGGESLLEVSARVKGALEELFATEGRDARNPEGDLVVVSHVSPIKAAVAWALGQPVEMIWRLYLSTGGITRIGWSAGAPVVHSYNEAVPPRGSR